MSEKTVSPPKVRVEIHVHIDDVPMRYYSDDLERWHDVDVDAILDKASTFLTVNVWNEYHRIMKERG